jgi:hypothetical protein
MLSCDKIAVGSNVIINSSVFVNDILFGGKDQSDQFFLSFIHPIVVHENPNIERPIRSMYEASNARSDYMSERTAAHLMDELDGYFLMPGNQDRFIRYPQDLAAGNYVTWMRRAVSELRSSTRDHLLGCWRHLRSRTTVPTEVMSADEAMARDMTDTILDVVDLFTLHLKGPLTRSKLYHLAGLFITVLDDQNAINDQLHEDTVHTVIDELVSCRAKMLSRPWISGPLCRELFDSLYNWNPIVYMTTTSPSAKSIVFLEEHEKASARFVASLVGGGFRALEDTVSVGVESKASALLLGNASEQDMVEYRAALAPFRGKLATDDNIDDGMKALLSKELAGFQKSAVDVEDQPISAFEMSTEDIRLLLLEFLGQCVFLVRKSEALDRMYEEPQLALPGLMRLQATLDA